METHPSNPESFALSSSDISFELPSAISKNKFFFLNSIQKPTFELAESPLVEVKKYCKGKVVMTEDFEIIDLNN